MSEILETARAVIARHDASPNSMHMSFCDAAPAPDPRHDFGDEPVCAKCGVWGPEGGDREPCRPDPRAAETPEEQVAAATERAK